ncbi:hypothetical protein GII33_18170 [Gordonia pseudamarae]|jgi:hypothetical protein|uniref:Peptidase C39-like domain-containing protein n=1 Tax=Gordonia pseudamarae TaxID=2831662 RepID=A0ABX6IMT7_9ACTN|nr:MULTISPECIES: hypothetical protein [Gordonia]MBD0021245.1 hypothetical protein [Gordonia sp. (in: high G+C Gram-positive bacteria)]QHN27608.1 hypothetical protein GII33_18170 [Gordonia pseudamarae]QHN36490.1 hypothetical protein GII31_17945 [Gordonia pseudamarae]
MADFAVDTDPDEEVCADEAHPDTDPAVPSLGIDTDEQWRVPETGEPQAGRSPTGDSGPKEEFDEHWFYQATDGTCVPASVAQIVSEYSGVEFTDESAFVAYAMEQGMFVDGEISNGMTIEDSYRLMVATGIPATMVEGSTIDDLETLVESGHGAMVFVDSGYWNPGAEILDEWLGTDVGADHCVVITEIDREAGVVYLSDTGTPDGNQLAVPLDEFEKAWAESNNTMIVCDEPSPNAEFLESGTDKDSSALGTQTPGTQALGAQDTSRSGEDIGRELLERTPDDQQTIDVEDVVSWATDNPWILLPIVIGAGAALGKAGRR